MHALKMNELINEINLIKNNGLTPIEINEIVEEVDQITKINQLSNYLFTMDVDP